MFRVIFVMEDMFLMCFFSYHNMIRNFQKITSELLAREFQDYHFLIFYLFIYLFFAVAFASLNVNKCISYQIFTLNFQLPKFEVIAIKLYKNCFESFFSLQIYTDKIFYWIVLVLHWKTPISHTIISKVHIR